MVYNENRENDRDHYWYPCMLPCHALALDTCSTVRVVFITRAWIYISYYHATLMYVYIQCINILRNEIYGIECCLCTCRNMNYQLKYWKLLCTRIYIYIYIYRHTHTQCKIICKMMELKWMDVNWVQVKHCIHRGTKAHGSCMLLNLNA